MEGSRAAAAESLATAEAVIAALPDQQSAAVSQLRLHALALTTLRQLAAGNTGDILRSGAGTTRTLLPPVTDHWTLHSVGTRTVSSTQAITASKSKRLGVHSGSPGQASRRLGNADIAHEHHQTLWMAQAVCRSG